MDLGRAPAFAGPGLSLVSDAMPGGREGHPREHAGRLGKPPFVPIALRIRHEDAIGSAQARETRGDGAPGPEQCR